MTVVALLIILAAVVTYLVIGYTATRVGAPMLARRSTNVTRYSYPAIKEYPYVVEFDQGAMIRDQFLMLFLWPALAPLLAADKAFRSDRERFDPATIRAQSARIKELEAELGIDQGVNS